MAEIVVENQVCKTCGAEVRPHALFCYNCGGAISENPVKTESKNGNSENTVLFPDDNYKTEVVEKKRVIETNDEIQKSGAPEITLLKDKKTDIVNEAKLKSAASLRNKAKSFQKKEVQIIWEEPESPSGVLFALVVLLLTAFAVTIVVLAIYLK